MSEMRVGMLADSNIAALLGDRLFARMDAEARREKRELDAEMADRAEREEARGEEIAFAAAQSGRELPTAADVFARAEARMNYEDRKAEIQRIIAEQEGEPIEPDYSGASQRFHHHIDYWRRFAEDPRRVEQLRRQVVKDDLGLGQSRSASNRSSRVAGERTRFGGPIVRVY
jgi:hypothetical protein